MKFRGLLVVAMLAASTLGIAPAQAMNQPENLFTNTGVSQITVHISPADSAKLVKAPKMSVKGTFDIVGPNSSFNFTNLPITFHLKGTSTLKQNPSLLTNRPSLRVKFKRGGFLKLGFLGSLNSLTLNSMTQDGSKIHEYSSYLLYNAVGVPAPRVGYATVNVAIGNQVLNKGLFAIIEPYDASYLKQKFPTKTQHLYEPCSHWTDVTRPGASKGGAGCTNSLFETKVGWGKHPNKLDLAALASVQKISNNAAWWDGMKRYTDRNEMVKMWATENFISAWDSYSGAIINNYYLRTDSLGVFSMMPTGADEAFEFNYKMDASSIAYPLIYSDFKVQSKNRGYMFTRCLRYKPCFNQYLDDLKLISKTATKMDLVGKMKAISKTIAPYAGLVNYGQIAAENWVAMKQGEVTALLAKYGR